jgi:hypothetical protein
VNHTTNTRVTPLDLVLGINVFLLMFTLLLTPLCPKSRPTPFQLTHNDDYRTMTPRFGGP